MQGCGAAIAFAAAGASVDTAAAAAADVADLLEGLPDNWGRWGEDDELGALNLLGSAQARAGMRAALRGGGVERFALQLSMTGETVYPPDADDPGPSAATGDPAFPGRTPARRDNEYDERSYDEGEQQPLAGMKFSDDRFVNPLYLQGTTHVDALGHAWYGERIYNGFDAITTAETKTFSRPVENCEGGTTSETRGLGRADISGAASEGFAGRGVLLDVGRCTATSGDRLAPGERVTLDDLRATANAQGVELRERDVLLVRTGSIARTRDPEAPWDPLNEPGLYFSENLVRWVHEMDIPCIGADNLAVEKVTHVVDGQAYVLPLHGAFLRNLGVYLNEILWLEDLADACAADGVYEFLFTAAPLNVERSTGAPVNPLVLKATEDARQRPAETPPGGRGRDDDGRR